MHVTNSWVSTSPWNQGLASINRGAFWLLLVQIWVGVEPQFETHLDCMALCRMDTSKDESFLLWGSQLPSFYLSNCRWGKIHLLGTASRRCFAQLVALFARKRRAPSAVACPGLVCICSICVPLNVPRQYTSISDFVFDKDLLPSLVGCSYVHWIQGFPPANCPIIALAFGFGRS